MGKTIRNVNVKSRSENYLVDKSRTFRRKLDRSSHHANRNENRNADELAFVKSKTNEHAYQWKTDNHDCVSMGNANCRQCKAEQLQAKRRGTVGMFAGYSRDKCESFIHVC